ncbi:anaerobic ribonucleoside triphosphate reductase [Candidatus Nitrosocosmicus oleophilus]|uniref:Anaerobic ribonucleoside triphosphate reductase n=1 Tax=Candidatus Nitrosocosmicus oleophilus TaxID=1353260 RepID=A0A654LW13_9ARCH|nr:ATP cone domain-containing protein [Candidatus Nitrosocosmicus oleophilus]ALI35395.1 anaerobic ribonucleoside triphosphate reductase [Candidatus Nitrosocosmicus oleophilus]
MSKGINLVFIIMQNSNNQILVRKRNDNTESFDLNKLTSSISRSGVPFTMAKDIAESINDYIKINNNDNLVRSNEIREFVISELKKRNQKTIAKSYSGYSKNKVTKIREEQTHDIKHDSKTIPTTESHQKQFSKDKDNPTGSGAKR